MKDKKIKLLENKLNKQNNNFNIKLKEPIYKK